MFAGVRLTSVTSDALRFAFASARLLFGALTNRGEFVNRVGLEAAFEIDQEGVDLIAIDLSKDFENFIVEIILRPILGGGGNSR